MSQPDRPHIPKKEELVRDVNTSVCLGCSDHEVLVSQIPRNVGKESKRTWILEFRA